MMNGIFTDEENNHDNRVAVFIDNDNIQHSCKDAIDESYSFDVLINECSKYGRIVSSKIYLDTTRAGSMQYELYKRGIEPVYSPFYLDSNGGGKSLTDPIIMCDVLKCLYEDPHIDTFVIASSDKDFVPLIRSITQYHIKKRIVVIGVRKSTARLVIEECARHDDASFLDYVILHQKNEFELNNE